MEDNQPSEYRKIRVVSYGLGPIGMKAARIVLSSSCLEMVGAVDIDPQKVGEDVGNLLGFDREIGISVSHDWHRVLANHDVDVVLHATGSRLKEIYPQIRDIVGGGANCVSSTEELFFPYSENSPIAKQIDTLAREHGVTVLGTGVNPGFVMDTLPLFLTGVCQKVKSIQVERVVDASTRRLPLQKKIGANLTPQLFRNKVRKRLLGHAGLRETMNFLACNLGWNLDKVEETIDPVIANQDASTQYLKIAKGCVAGINHTLWGMRKGEKVIHLNLQMYVGAKDPHDLIRIKGNPNLEVQIREGTPGDIATAAVLVNTIPSVIQAKPGLITMKDLSLLQAINGDHENLRFGHS